MTIVLPEGSWVKKLVDLATGALGSKLLVYGLGVAAVLFGARLWLNAHDDKVFKQGGERVAAGIRQEYDVKFQQRLEVVQAERAVALADRKSVEVRLDQVTKLFDQAFERLRGIREAVEERKIIYVEKAAAVPPAGLDNAIRNVSNDIAGKAADGSGKVPNP